MEPPQTAIEKLLGVNKLLRWFDSAQISFMKKQPLYCSLRMDVNRDQALYAGSSILSLITTHRSLWN